MALRDPRASYVALLSSVCIGLSAIPCARAETPSEPPPVEVNAARALFFEALREEQAQKFEDALRDYRRVQMVRDTAAIEYRVGVCEEALGRPAAAFGSFQAAVSLAGNDAHAADVADAARRELEALAPRIARLTLVKAPAEPAASVPVVALDGQRLAPESLGLPLIVDPGRHVLTTVYGPGPTLRAEIALASGQSVSWTLPAPPPATATTPAVGENREGAPGSGGALRSGALIGWVTGGALVAGAGVLWWLRSDDIADLKRTCPGGVCPAGADRNALEATRSRALAEGPWAAVLVGTGVLAAGVGTVLALSAWSRRDSASPHAELLPSVGPMEAGILVRGAFR